MDSLLLPMFCHVLWVMFLYVLLTAVRAPKVWGVTSVFDKIASWEPRVSANLSNQFEWPLFFYIACLILMLQGNISDIQIGLSWVFVTGRVLHSLVQILQSNIRIRGVAFTLNFLAVVAMWLGLMLDQIVV